MAGSFLRRVPGKHLVLNVRIVFQELAKLCVRWSYLFQTERVVSCERQECKKMVFPAAIRENSQRGVALSCDAHVVFASSGEIRQPCTVSLGDSVSCEIFFNRSAFLRGKLNSGYFSFIKYHLIRTRNHKHIYIFLCKELINSIQSN